MKLQPSSSPKTSLLQLAIFSLSLGWTAAAQSQKLRIVVLEAHHGHPVSDECLNISLGPWHGADILAPTDKDGQIILSIDGDRVSAEQVPGKSCNGMASTKPFSVAKVPTVISLVTDYYVSCQYSKAVVNDPVWLRESAAERIPSFSIQDILSRGIVADNNCSKLKPVPKTGELVLIVRNRTFWEGMKS